jgi:hypothetical protein
MYACGINLMEKGHDSSGRVAPPCLKLFVSCMPAANITFVHLPTLIFEAMQKGTMR